VTEPPHPDRGQPAGPVYADESVQVFHGDCLDVLAGMPDASIDAVVTDPPYGLEFMGNEWDRPWAVGMSAPGYGDAERMPRPAFGDSRNANCRGCGGRQRGAKRCDCAVPQWDRHPREDKRAFGTWCERWAAECLRLLKPGGHLLAFGGTRTWHRLAVAIEDVGFEVRDSIAWLYGQGFPKSLDVAKAVDRLDNAEAQQWAGWGTALKPAFEPIVVARKPLVGTVAANVLAHGTGALNIDATRVGTGDDRTSGGATGKRIDADEGYGGAWADAAEGRQRPSGGRWPANVVLDDTAAAELDRQTGTLTSGANPTRRGSDGDRTAYGEFGGQDTCDAPRGVDTGGASRFYPVFRYEPKAPTAERPRVNGEAHSTVKPLDLMRWLVRLVTPPGGTVLDPFAGSGTTAEACIIEGVRCVTVEREAAYLPLIVARLAKPIQPDLFGIVADDAPVPEWPQPGRGEPVEAMAPPRPVRGHRRRVSRGVDAGTAPTLFDVDAVP
jgi:DNA modification methylase